MTRLNVLVVLVGVALASFGLTLLLVLSANEERADTGVSARDQQCDREPVSAKIARAAYAVRESLPAKDRITKEELERFLRAGPRDCPR
jgi:hypothetical protein